MKKLCLISFTTLTAACIVLAFTAGTAHSRPQYAKAFIAKYAKPDSPEATEKSFAAVVATGMAVVQTGQAVARMLSSVLFGLAWTLWDLRPAVLVAAACLAAVALAAAFVKPVRP